MDLFSALAGPTSRLPSLLQSVASDSTAAGASGSSALRDLWNLVEQAGPLRWPIFVVLAVGLALVFSKLYELLRDRSASVELLGADFRDKSLADIRDMVSRQAESMLASLQSTMLNVFHTRPTEGMLHDEIANFVSFQQGQFEVFRRRMEFLADTAGALGLMGTVWGMFEVFFQGTSDQDVILRGMGIALITTLLGLVVSILLNLSATELSTFFGKRLERISTKSDELRFRLLELAADNARQDSTGTATASEASIRVVPAPPQEGQAPSSASETRSPATPVWYVEADPPGCVAQAGETVQDILLRLRNGDGESPSGVVLALSVPPNGGTLDGDEREIRRTTDAEGSVRIAWRVPERVGTYALDVAVPAHPGSGRRVEVQVQPAAPEHVELVGDHQAAVAGMRLPRPLIARVLDRFGNPVPGIEVTYTVAEGDGRLAQSGSQAVVETGENGVAQCAFAVGSSPGANSVEARVAGVRGTFEFVAFGTEV